MPVFRFHLRTLTDDLPDDIGLELGDLHQAYLQACASIPDMSRDMLIAGKDLMECAFTICDAQGRRLLEVPFTEILSPSEWRARRARRSPCGGVRSGRARDDLALSAFRRMFGSVNIASVLLTPELRVMEISEFGARHSHVDRDAVRDMSILDIFDLKDEPKRHFTDFMLLARAGAVSEVVDLPYYVLDGNGRTVNGWWSSRT